ncbi:hypothetical protein P4O66_022235 [Electrophorus voltai]|uniref:Apoptosis facilitator Bcl-2-like protein 14 n=1 Tax=Electrophorus voltai TaxID=2609070 RepID=A0AAD8ZPR6_9TELE|nr:hypothetical protein P4O66_022235 [Electrophorus voltai]
MPKADHATHVRPLLFFDQRSTKRLLEVYVKRSLSLNDAGPSGKWRLKSHKWVTQPQGSSQARRAVSDISSHRQSIERVLKTTEFDKLCESDSMLSSSRLCSLSIEKQTQNPTKPARKSFLRVFFQWFSRNGSERRAEGVSPTHTSCSSECRVHVTRLSPEGASESLPHPSKAVKKKHSFKRISLRNRDMDKSESSQKPFTLSPGDMVRPLDVVTVEPTNAYFENVSKEMERIVKEVKGIPVGDGAGSQAAAAAVGGWSPPTDDVTIEKIITLMKQHGDAINEKIQKDSTMKLFFQRLSYTSFQKLADQYISQIPQTQEQVSHAAPELVQLAFTLDFTAKVAGLSSQAVSRIMGFGNQYLQDRFTQICSVHSNNTRVDEDVEKQCNSDPE